MTQVTTLFVSCQLASSRAVAGYNLSSATLCITFPDTHEATLQTEYSDTGKRFLICLGRYTLLSLGKECFNLSHPRCVFPISYLYHAY